MAGTLYVVATPLGNLGDWSPRARETVAGADLVLVEDTRVSHRLFESFGLKPRVRVFERHRERRETDPLIEELRQGRRIALITDAGTPGVADPGALLVDAALAAGIAVVAVPGPSILAAAASVSGAAELPLIFHGYPPPKAGEVDALLDELRGAPGAHVLLVPPHDAERLLERIAAKLPSRRLVLCRELTKLHEEVAAGTAAELLGRLRATDTARGEMALVIRAPAGETEAAAETAALTAEALRLKTEYGLAGKDLSDFLAFKTGVPRRTAYRVVQDLKDRP